MPKSKPRPAFADRMSDPLGDYSPPDVSRTEAWSHTHHKHTSWLSDELWAELGERAEQSGRSKSAELEAAVRTAYEMPPDE